MIITNLGIFSIIVYVIWKTFTTINRLTTDMLNEKSLKLMPILEIIYTCYMIYLLIIGSKMFLFLAAIAFITHISIGMFVEIFHPELRKSKSQKHSILTSYWLYVVFDTLLTLISYAVVTDLFKDNPK